MKHKYRYPRFSRVLSHEISFARKTLLPFALPIVLLVIGILIIGHSFPSISDSDTRLPLILRATLATVLRIGVAYIASVVLAIPIALFVTRNTKIQSVLLPVIDVLESIPVLAFFPIIILMFIKIHVPEGAAFFVLTVSMLWSIVFSLIGGINLIPRDIADAAKVFGLKGFSYIRYVALPALVPELVTGSILSVANGWNIIVVAEVLHTYVTQGSTQNDLFGLGSLLVKASATGDTNLFVLALSAMIIFIGILNVFVWQKLLRKAENFRFE